jgi:hypothetical protein
MDRRSIRRSIALPIVAALAACHHGTSSAATRAPMALAPAESMFQAVHLVKDRIGVTSARGASADTDGTSLAELRRRYAAIRTPLATALAHIDSAHLAPEDQHALGAMRASLAGGLASDADDTESGDAASHAPPD